VGGRRWAIEGGRRAFSSREGCECGRLERWSMSRVDGTTLEIRVDLWRKGRGTPHVQPSVWLRPLYYTVLRITLSTSSTRLTQFPPHNALEVTPLSLPPFVARSQSHEVVGEIASGSFGVERRCSRGTTEKRKRTVARARRFASSSNLLDDHMIAAVYRPTWTALVKDESLRHLKRPLAPR
jgi:hypothetical protein